ncbi:MAG: pyridoxamine 5'-phosphate oxidase family protein [Clostridiales bacterium]|nr:pyridoxamine 5'-phosphate oxidase family protein [Clostridiales bacterium]
MMATALAIMEERFQKDSLIALATLDGDRPSVRTVDAYYDQGSFYVVTHALSGKMQQIERHSTVGISGEWFTGHGVAKNIGHVLLQEHQVLMEKIRCAFQAWYGNGHVNETDPHTCILEIRLTDGVLMHQGVRYELDFANEQQTGGKP